MRHPLQSCPTRASFSLRRLLLLCSSVILLEQGLTAQAQIIPNGAGTVVNPQGNQINITGGTQAGANLFHSFRDFNLTPAQIANFLSNPQTQNILARINGGNPSFINGLLQVTGGNSNLFLMNPAGIVLGQGASLNVPASFTATTANQIGLGNNQYFSATGNNNYAALTGNPDSFLFTTTQAGSIVNAGNLAVGSGQNLSLIAGNTINTGRLSAPGGEIQVLAVPGTNRVRLSQPGQVLSLEIVPPVDGILKAVDLPALLTGSGELPGIVVNPTGVQVAGTSLPNQQGIAVASGRIDVSSATGNGGTVQVLGDTVAALDSQINANGATGGGTVRLGGEYLGGRDTVIAPALRFNSQRTLVDRDSLIRANATVSGEGGRVIVWADQNTGYFGRITGRGATGLGGFVEVSGKENLAFDGRVELQGFNGLGGTLLLDPANIVIGAATTDDAQIADGIIGAGEAPGATWFISAGALASIAAGTAIDIAATNNIDFQANVNFTGGVGAAPITFTAGNITATTGTQLNTRGRNITMNADSINAPNLSIDTVPLAGTNPIGNITLSASNGNLNINNIFARNFIPNFVPGGNITLTSIGGGITISGELSSYSVGNGGAINLTSTSGGIAISGFVTSGSNSGNGGAINLTSTGGGITTSGSVDASSSNIGNGGAINITSAGGGITTTGAVVSSSFSGNGGAVNLTSAGGGITTTGAVGSSSFSGNGGAINLTSTGGIATSAINSSSIASGNGGAINLTSTSGGITSNIVTSSSNTGNGGAINLTSTSGGIAISGFVTSSSRVGNGGAINLTSIGGGITTGYVESSSLSGNGGAINLTSAGGGITSNSFIISSGAGGVLNTSGNITIDAGTDPTTGNLVRLNGNVSVGSCISVSICSAGDGGAGNGNITIRHNGGTSIPFIIGDATTNGAFRAINAGTGNIIPITTTIPVPPTTYTQGIVNIITTASPIVPPVVPPAVPVAASPTISPELFALLRNPAPPATPAPVVVGTPPVAPVVEPPISVTPVLVPTPIPSPVVITNPLSIPTPTSSSVVVTTPIPISTPSTSPNISSELRTTLANVDSQDTRLEQEPPSGTLAFITNPSGAEIAARLSTLGSSQNDLLAIQNNLNQTFVNNGRKSAQIYVFFTPQNLASRNEDTLEIILITGRGEPRRVQISGITRSQVLGVVDNLRSRNGNDPVNLSAARQIYQWILAPLESELQQQGINNLIFILNGELRNLSLESLYDGRGFIRERFTISRP